jgi:hypothetical protein
VNPADRLAALAEVSSSLRKLEAGAAAGRELRDEMITGLARDRVPHKDIGAAAGITPQAVGKLARAAGIRRRRSTEPH